MLVVNRLTAIRALAGPENSHLRFIYIGIVEINNTTHNTNTPTMVIHFPF
jgi:hypothetical protein